MTGTSQNRWRRQAVVAGSAVLGLLLLVSCDNRALPTQPTGSAPGPQVQRATRPIAFVSNRDGTEKIYLANEDGSMVTPLVAGRDPAWAKAGGQIAFSAAGPNIRVIGVDGSGDRVIAGRGQNPSWSPDGRSLVFVGYSSGPSRLELVNVEGSNRRSLLDDGYAWLPKWSPDGQRILYVNDGGFVDPCFGLWTVNADGSDARQLGGPGVGRPFASCSFSEEASLSNGTWPAWSLTAPRLLS